MSRPKGIDVLSMPPSGPDRPNLTRLPRGPQELTARCASLAKSKAALWVMFPRAPSPLTPALSPGKARGEGAKARSVEDFPQSVPSPLAPPGERARVRGALSPQRHDASHTNPAHLRSAGSVP